MQTIGNLRIGYWEEIYIERYHKFCFVYLYQFFYAKPEKYFIQIFITLNNLVYLKLTDIRSNSFLNMSSN